MEKNRYLLLRELNDLEENLQQYLTEKHIDPDDWCDNYNYDDYTIALYKKIKAIKRKLKGDK